MKDIKVTMRSIEEDDGFVIRVFDNDLGKKLWWCNITNGRDKVVEMLEAVTEAVTEAVKEWQKGDEHDLKKLTEICNNIIK